MLVFGGVLEKKTLPPKTKTILPLQETNISQLGKKEIIIFKSAFERIISFFPKTVKHNQVTKKILGGFCLVHSGVVLLQAVMYQGLTCWATETDFFKTNCGQSTSICTMIIRIYVQWLSDDIVKNVRVCASRTFRSWCKNIVLEELTTGT